MRGPASPNGSGICAPAILPLTDRRYWRRCSPTAPISVSRAWPMPRAAFYHRLVNVAQWHISDDNYVAARAAIINAPHGHPMAAIWDDGTTSSSDGQYFRVGGRAGAGASVNAKYGIDPGAVI
jgi:Tn3 transposase DDE domain